MISEKSAGLAPANAIEDMFSAALPELESVSDCSVLVVFAV